MIPPPRRRYNYTQEMVETYGPSKLDALDVAFIHDAWWVASVISETAKNAVDEMKTTSYQNPHFGAWSALWQKVEVQSILFMNWMKNNREIDYVPTEAELADIEKIMLSIRTLSSTYAALGENLVLNDFFNDADITMRHVASHAKMMTKKINAYQKKRQMKTHTTSFLNKTKLNLKVA